MLSVPWRNQCTAQKHTNATIAHSATLLQPNFLLPLASVCVGPSIKTCGGIFPARRRFLKLSKNRSISAFFYRVDGLHCTVGVDFDFASTDIYAANLLPGAGL